MTKNRYDKLSSFYSLADLAEKGYIKKALKNLEIHEGEYVLEIGFGTGRGLKRIAELVGEDGRVFGIDISQKMLNIARKRLKDSKLLNRVELFWGDAMEMPFKSDKFDKVFMSFTLELFDDTEIPALLNEVKRVLKSDGKVGILGLSKEGKSFLRNIYERIQRKFPDYIDCRPIYIERHLKDSGFKIEYEERLKIFYLPAEIVVGVKP